MSYPFKASISVVSVNQNAVINHQYLTFSQPSEEALAVTSPAAPGNPTPSSLSPWIFLFPGHLCWFLSLSMVFSGGSPCWVHSSSSPFLNNLSQVLPSADPVPWLLQLALTEQKQTAGGPALQCLPYVRVNCTESQLQWLSKVTIGFRIVYCGRGGGRKAAGLRI